MRARVLAAALAATMVLSACESSTDKAEKHYQAALTLLEQGDDARAEVELKNVFRFKGDHLEARRKLAELLMKKGDVRGAYSQYLRLAEQYPQDAQIRRDLAKIAIDVGNWDEAERHGRLGEQLDPANPDQKDITLAIDYRRAIGARNDTDRAAVVKRAQDVLAEQPENITALRVMVADTVSGADPRASLPLLDRLIAIDPKVREPWLLKLGVLTQLKDDPAIEAVLEEMIAAFPDDVEMQASQAAFYVQRGDIDRAEQVMRRVAEREGATRGQKLALVRFIETNRGTEQAMAEAERQAGMATTADDRGMFVALKAYYMFNTGRQDEAMATLETSLAEAPPGDQTNRMRAMLAGMRMTTGNRAAADALVAEVLAADATNVQALRVKAEGLLADDKADQAIIELRRALDQDPRDVDTMGLLANAYERAGNRQVMGETLASAVDVSGNAPPQVLRYANFLVADNRVAAARSVIEDGLRANPADVNLLIRAGQLALQDKAFARAAEVAERLSAIPNDPRAQQLAQALRGESLVRQGRTDEGLQMLEQRAQETSGAADAVVAVVRARVAAGQLPEARAYLEETLAKDPGNADLQLINASLLIAENRRPEAEKVLRQVIADHGDRPGPVQLLHAYLMAERRTEDAAQLLAEALQRMPDNQNLNLLHAAALEQAGQIDEAIAVYDRLYTQDTSNVVMANNLASMLATWRSSDPAALARATAVAQRLKDTPVPAFQDTYGWIAHLNGRSDEALPYLEKAAPALPMDPLVRFHLGMVQAALGQGAQARESLTRALAIAGDRDLPQMKEAETKLTALGGPVALPDETAGATAPAAVANPAGTETAPSSAPALSGLAPAPEVDDAAPAGTGN